MDNIKKGANEMTETGALTGVKVLDMGRVLAGPLCTSILGDMGADVIKLETPNGGDHARSTIPLGGYFAVFNRNKRGITLDLKKGKDIFLKLIEEVDVVVENFRPGVMNKLGLGYEQLKEIKPGIIYAAISGYGQEGPYSQWAGYDPMAQAMSGVMSVTGFDGNPPVRCGASFVDVMAAVNTALGIVLALYHRTQTGQGQMIDVALTDVSVAAMSSVTQRYLTDGIIPGKMGNGYVAGAPGSSYKALDGEVVFFPQGDAGWKKLCELMGRQELQDAPEFFNLTMRVKNRKKVDMIVEEWTQTKTVDELLQIFRDAKMAASPVLNVEQVVNDPHIAGVRDMFPTLNYPGFGDMKITNQPIKLSGTPSKIRLSPPALGQHNHEVYAGLGYHEEEIKSFKDKGII